MKFIQFLLVIFVLLGVSNAKGADKPNLQQEVKSAFSEFSRAFQAADVTILKTMLAEDYIHVNGGSGNVINQEQWLKWLASRRAEMDAGEFLFESYKVEDLQVQLFGETAIVIGITRANGIRKGSPFTLALKFTNVWIKKNGKWRRAAFHDSALPKVVP